MASLGFSISGEYITEQARIFLKEGRPSAAWDLIAGCVIGISPTQAIEVLCGRKKFVGVNDVNLADDDPKAPDPVTFMFELLRGADKYAEWNQVLKGWRDTAGVCHQAYHPKRNSVGCKNMGSPVGLISEKVAKRMAGADSDAIPGLLMDLFPKFTDKEYEDFYERRGTEMRELVDECEPWTRNAASLSTLAKPLADKAAQILTGPPPPKPTLGNIKTDDNGWILPNGKFYSCGWMGHSQLAYDLIGGDDRTASAAGWVRVSLSEMSGTKAIVQGSKEPTQKQLAVVTEFCKTRKLELPDWAGGSGSGFYMLEERVVKDSIFDQDVRA